MTQQAVQIIARGPRADAEAAARAIDEDPMLEAATYSILEEDEDRDVWRIDAFPVSTDEAQGLVERRQPAGRTQGRGAWSGAVFANHACCCC